MTFSPCPAGSGQVLCVGVGVGVGGSGGVSGGVSVGVGGKSGSRHSKFQIPD